LYLKILIKGDNYESKNLRFVHIFIVSIRSPYANADIIRQAKVISLILPADGNKTAVAAFEVINDSIDFPSVCGNERRVKFDKTNKELYSYILSLYTMQKEVGFYFNPNGNILSRISGHGMGYCELQSIWANY